MKKQSIAILGVVALLCFNWIPVNAQHVSPEPHDVLEEEVQFQSGDITIAATLFSPPGTGAMPAIIIAHGSDAASRKDPHYRASAIWWTQAGYRVLLSDKRGVGDSGGEYVDPPDLRIPAGDLLAAVQYLSTRTDIQAANIGVIGGSQGGWVGWIAARSGEIAFVVSLSGPGVSVLEQVVYIRGQEMLDEGFTAPEVTAATRYRRLLYNYYGTGDGRDQVAALLDSVRYESWFQRAQFRDSLPEPIDLGEGRFDFYRNLQFDPDSVLSSLKIPILAVFGGMDRNVPVDESISRMRAAFVRAGSQDATIIMFPRAGHGLGLIPLGTDGSSRASHGSLELAPGFVDTVIQWLRRQATNMRGSSR